VGVSAVDYQGELVGIYDPKDIDLEGLNKLMTTGTTTAEIADD
jgi:hypothetical protein